MNYKGYTIKLFQEDGEWFWSSEEEGMTFGTYDKVGSQYRDGKATRGQAVQSAKSKINELYAKGV